MRKALDDGKELGMPDGVLINGKGPYRYNDTLVPDGIDYETIEVHPGRFLVKFNSCGTKWETSICFVVSLTLCFFRDINMEFFTNTHV